MSSFPILKSGAVQQYPASKSLAFTNHLISFIDGTEQRYRSSPAALRRWAIQLTLLDNGEMSALHQFFVDQQGAFESFTFNDPWDNAVYANCSIEQDRFTADFEEEMRARTELVVRENRS